jgi:HemY protein
VQQLWGKAQSYLEASLAIAPSAEGHIRMAELKTQSGQPGEACKHYQKALELCRAE